MMNDTTINHRGRTATFAHCSVCKCTEDIVVYDDSFYCFDHFILKANDDANYYQDDQDRLDAIGDCARDCEKEMSA